MFIGLQRPLLGERPQLERRTFLTILYSSDAMKSVETLDGVFWDHLPVGKWREAPLCGARGSGADGLLIWICTGDGPAAECPQSLPLWLGI